MGAAPNVEPEMGLSASSIQEMLARGLVQAPNLARLPDTFLTDTLAGHHAEQGAVRQAAEAMYMRAYYGFVVDLDLDAVEERKSRELARLLKIGDSRAAELNYQVGVALYAKTFRDAVADGELTEDENRRLQTVAGFFGLRRRDVRQAVRKHALQFYSLKLTEAIQDGILTEEEMSELTVIAKTWGLTARELADVTVPEKMDVLRAALTSIKAKGKIDQGDREHVRSLTYFLNAPELLKPCLMDLDLYERLFAIRRGVLPEADPGSLILENGEHLHGRLSVIYETLRGPKLNRASGTLYVGSAKLRFVGRARSHAITYRNILEVSFQNTRTPKLQISLSSGRGSGRYRLTRGNSPAALLELKEMVGYLIRKAHRILPPSRRPSSHIPEHIRSEVYARDGGVCVMCGAREYIEFDHIIPRSKGGATTVANLQILCRRCNSEKSDQI